MPFNSVLKTKKPFRSRTAIQSNQGHWDKIIMVADIYVPGTHIAHRIYLYQVHI